MSSSNALYSLRAPKIAKYSQMISEVVALLKVLYLRGPASCQFIWMSLRLRHDLPDALCCCSCCGPKASPIGSLHRRPGAKTLLKDKSHACRYFSVRCSRDDSINGCERPKKNKSYEPVTCMVKARASESLCRWWMF
jgi:hypothetical protein